MSPGMRIVEETRGTHICSMVALFGGAFLRLVGENQQKVGEKSYEGKSALAMHLLREHNILYKYK